jgi:VWFA-related protein
MPLVRAAALLTLVLVVTALPVPQQAQTRFSSKVDALRLDVYVDLTEPGGSRLTAEDFAVLDNGRPRRATLIDVDAMPINVALLLDGSLSMAGADLPAMVSAVDAVLERILPDDRVGLMTFSDLVETRAPFTSDVAAVRRALANARSVGRTSLTDAVLAGVVAASGAEGRTMLLVCSDGLDNTSFLSRASVEAVLRGSEVVVYTVTIGRGEDLVGIAEATGGAAFSASGPGGMAKTFANAIANFRSRYLLSVTLDSDSSPGWHDVSVKLTRRQGKVRHRAGYWTEPPRPPPAPRP